jgi:hypothetical protein
MLLPIQAIAATPHSLAAASWLGGSKLAQRRAGSRPPGSTVRAPAVDMDCIHYAAAIHQLLCLHDALSKMLALPWAGTLKAAGFIKEWLHCCVGARWPVSW